MPIVCERETEGEIDRFTLLIPRWEIAERDLFSYFGKNPRLRKNKIYGRRINVVREIDR